MNWAGCSVLVFAAAVSGFSSFVEHGQASPVARPPAEAVLLAQRAVSFEPAAGPRGVTLRALEFLPAPAAPLRADVLYLPGFADRAEAHEPLFQELTAAGFRVLTFDYPQHGLSEGGGLNDTSFRDLAAHASEVLELFEAGERPLSLLGWSTGGLIATRILQGAYGSDGVFSHPIHSAVLLAPAIFPRKIVGDFGIVTRQSLTRNPNPPFNEPVRPSSPLLFPFFAARYLAESTQAQRGQPLREVPVLVVFAGEDSDRYVETAPARKWFRAHNSGRTVPVVGRVCAGAFHELDNEPGEYGSRIRLTVSRFFEGDRSPIGEVLPFCEPL